MTTTQNGINYYNIQTRYAGISVIDTGGSGLPVLFIHGNSSCKEIFRHQINQLKGKYRVLALDLPGHGSSSNASESRQAYSMPGYAHTVIEVLEKIGINRVVVFGWSLGGHIGLEMLALFPKMIGLMICGAPPVSVGADNVALGFRPGLGLAGKAEFTEEDIKNFVSDTYGVNAPHEPFIIEAVIRTDGLARQYMFEAFLSPQATDQKLLAETSQTPLAIVNGADDPYINFDYINGLNYRNLWKRKIVNLAGLGHAPFWEAPELFNPILVEFLKNLQ
ncbi:MULTISPECIES: alpha/beta fold hydrolase [Xenorhabdus]|uniref:Epoxide hydrolase n=1 Tax=Xenorhabdus ehlersii TaxID=290111 RepID=A0A2D0IS88_9GAMM|nr:MULTISPECIES: alpha/beta hydrolase [Xenorhabdus]MBC8949573.1 epoxide hydrolase [Xenorhabdus sp. TS4]PHM24756.1 epoxide hydrolase [Xenorhabdus ehlersii]RKE91391.1 pimeloyl-ACP methyl ester carboxylesterase [Xenorhabdus ehlersii]